jgi:hypothetical protein
MRALEQASPFHAPPPPLARFGAENAAFPASNPSNGPCCLPHAAHPGTPSLPASVTLLVHMNV